ncbi:hypothetical protein GGX14DRAFT_391841 [Mycena pura]|uniref:Uncharacterized protein n=1 Tax=Mycena pura TaxID=153505 RepID=A0AAD6VK61_9AGAR|nr:hypothetical protein GGX14DRAFT_391841 [Mycena pura]
MNQDLVRSATGHRPCPSVSILVDREGEKICRSQGTPSSAVAEDDRRDGRRVGNVYIECVGFDGDLAIWVYRLRKPEPRHLANDLHLTPHRGDILHQMDAAHTSDSQLPKGDFRQYDQEFLMLVPGLECQIQSGAGLECDNDRGGVATCRSRISRVLQNERQVVERKTFVGSEILGMGTTDVWMDGRMENVMASASGARSPVFRDMGMNEREQANRRQTTSGRKIMLKQTYHPVNKH